MKTIYLDNPGELRMGESEAPVATALPTGHALVRVRRVGICGTDWHAYRGKQPFFSYPRVLGHELGVVVEAVNDPSSSLKPGDQCAVEPYLNCGLCIACRRGKSNCCANMRVLGVHVDGGMRERVVIPTAKLHRSDRLSLDQLALVETLGIGCHAVDRAGLKADEWVLVVGAGPIGLSVIPFVTAMGAKPIVLDVSTARLAFCKQHMKVEHTVDGNGDVLAALQQVTNNDLPTAVIDATGNPGSMAKAFDYVAPGGRIVFVGLFQGDVSFNDPNFHRREVSLHASRNALPRDFTRIIKLVEDGVVDTRPWITHRATVDGLLEAFPKWLSPDAGVIKAVVEF